MKSKLFLCVFVAAVLAGAGGWFAGRHWLQTTATPPATGARRVLYYQSSMHPWIKSDKPGKCTICGMNLTPVYEGDQDFDSSAGLVSLSSNSINVVRVQTAEAQRQPLRRSLRVAGMIEDNDARHRILSAYVDGRIDDLFVNFIGAEVEQGQPLAKFFSATLLNAEREYISLARRKTETEFPDLQRVNKQLIAASAQRLKQLGLSERQIAALPGKAEIEIHTEVLAPMSGTVVARNVYEGQYVKEGDKLFEIADFSTMWFLFDAYERDLAWIKTGQKVEITIPALPEKTFIGPITFIDPNLKDMTRSAKVRVEVSNPIIEEKGQKRRELFHKLYAQGIVQIEIPEVLAIPRSAVLSPGAQPVVYVDKKGGHYEQRRVKLGRAGDELWEVLDGLSSGESVVTTGNLIIDAQAQLNASANPVAKPSPASTNSTKTASIDAARQKAVRDFILSVDAVTKALSSDDLKGFNAESSELHASMPELINALEAATEWHPLLKQIEASGHLDPATNLAAARKDFFPLSQAAVEFAKKLRVQAEFGSLRIFHCPMVDRAIPGAPKNGYWIQTQAPVRNPFFGAAMIDCGTEVKP